MTEPTPLEWTIPVDPAAADWRRLAWLEFRSRQVRGMPLTKAEQVYMSTMQLMAAWPEYKASAEAAMSEFHNEMRGRRLAALKADADKLKAGLKDWGVPVAEYERVTQATGEDASRKRIVFEEKHGRAACDGLGRELKALRKLQVEIEALEAAPLGTAAAADAERRAAQVKAAREQQTGETPAAPARAPVPV